MWARLRAPLRPNSEVVESIRHALGEHALTTLLLGVTPELADIGRDLTAVDRSEGMIRGVWPGDTRTRRAVRADWLDLPCGPAAFMAVVGDGSLNALPYPEGHVRLHSELERVLAAGGRAVFRVFCRPDIAESLSSVLAEAMACRIESFHGFKWRFAMALAGERRAPNLPVRAIHSAFTVAVPDRTELARRTRWDLSDIDTIDVYRGSDEVYSFPTRDEVLAAVPAEFQEREFVGSGTYELSERCPLLVLSCTRTRPH